MNRKMLKKLNLSAETLRNLSEPQLEQALGGATNTGVCCTVATHACSACTPCA